MGCFKMLQVGLTKSLISVSVLMSELILYFVMSKLRCCVGCRRCAQDPSSAHQLSQVSDALNSEMNFVQHCGSSRT